MTTRRPFYGWWIAAALAVAEPVSWGVLYYAFSVFIEPMQQELGWSRNRLTLAFSLGLLTSGIAAMPIGHWLDRHGARWLMCGGSLAAAALLLGWSRTSGYSLFVLIWLALGVCMAATFYEPAFATLTVWFRRYRSRALTLVTFGGGFASVLFIPLTAWLIDRAGWRDALVALALILAGIAAPLTGLALRDSPERIGACVDGICVSREETGSPLHQRPGLPFRDAVRSVSFRWLSGAFGLTMFVNVSATVLLIPLLIDRGESLQFAATAAAAIGLLALPGRLIFTPLADWLPAYVAPAGIFLTQAAGLAVLGSSASRTGVWIFVVLFGIGFGAITPARATLVGDLYGVAAFASISGVLALIVTLSRAAAPIGGSLIGSLGDGDQLLFFILALMSVVAAVCVYASSASAERQAC